MIHAITVCHCEPAVLAMGLAQFLRTSGFERIGKYVLLDNCWPIDQENASDCIELISKMVYGEVFKVPQNLGGHGGFNYAFGKIALSVKHDDLILWYDPDSYPVTKGWLKAMKEVMDTDPKIAVLSLWPADLIHTDWTEEVIAGHRVRFFPTHAEMVSVSMWRASFIGNGVEAEYQWYGQIEAPAYRRCEKMGMRMGWLADFKEAISPIPHPNIFEDWKAAHVARKFNGNFDEWVKMHGK